MFTVINPVQIHSGICNVINYEPYNYQNSKYKSQFRKKWAFSCVQQIAQRKLRFSYINLHFHKYMANLYLHSIRWFHRHIQNWIKSCQMGLLQCSIPYLCSLMDIQWYHWWCNHPLSILTFKNVIKIFSQLFVHN